MKITPTLKFVHKLILLGALSGISAMGIASTNAATSTSTPTNVANSGCGGFSPEVGGKNKRPGPCINVANGGCGGFSPAVGGKNKRPGPCVTDNKI